MDALRALKFLFYCDDKESLDFVIKNDEIDKIMDIF